jgi:hypothetical protein
MRRNQVWALAAFGVLGCGDDSGPCTDIGCVDSFSVRITSTEEWPSGEYIFEVTLDGVPTRCTARLPEAVGASGTASSESFVCTGASNLSVFLSRETICTETRQGNSVSESCTPVPGPHYEFFASTAGKPTKISVSVSRDGTRLSEEPEPDYQNVSPNGPECGPICDQALVKLTF